MIKKIFCFIGMLVISFAYNMNHVMADQVTGGNDSSNITILVEEPVIQLVKVQSPAFNSFNRSKGSNTLTSKQDLVITVKDNREGGGSPWSIRYGISDFYRSDTVGENLGSKTNLVIGAGSIAKLSSSQYQSEERTLQSNEQIELVKATSLGADTFEHVVPKEAVQLIIDPSSKKGSYEFIQTVTLVLVPEVE